MQPRISSQLLLAFASIASRRSIPHPRKLRAAEFFLQPLRTNRCRLDEEKLEFFEAIAVLKEEYTLAEIKTTFDECGAETVGDDRLKCHLRE